MEAPRRAPPEEKNLAHLGRSDDVLGGSAFGASAPAPEDGIERWGRRIGRGLAIAGAIVIVALFLSNGAAP